LFFRASFAYTMLSSDFTTKTRELFVDLVVLAVAVVDCESVRVRMDSTVLCPSAAEGDRCGEDTLVFAGVASAGPVTGGVGCAPLIPSCTGASVVMIFGGLVPPFSFARERPAGVLDLSRFFTGSSKATSA
jgi:hypothetical protein